MRCRSWRVETHITTNRREGLVETASVVRVTAILDVVSSGSSEIGTSARLDSGADNARYETENGDDEQDTTTVRVRAGRA